MKNIVGLSRECASCKLYVIYYKRVITFVNVKIIMFKEHISLLVDTIEADDGVIPSSHCVVSFNCMCVA